MNRLFSYLKPDRNLLVLSWVSSTANKVFDLMPPFLVGWVIDSLRGAPPLWISHWVGRSDPLGMSVFLSGLAVVIFAFESVFQWGYQFGFMRLAQRVQHRLRMDAYHHLQQRELAFFENHRLGDTLSILNDDVNQIERFLNNGLNELNQLGVLFLFSSLSMCLISWPLALVGIFPIPFLIWGSLTFRSLISTRYRQVRECVGELNSRLENNIAGIQVVKSFTAESFEYERVRQVSDAYQQANFRAIRWSAAYVPLIRMVVVVGFAGVLLLGSYWVLRRPDILTVGELVLFAMLTERLLWPLARMGAVVDDLERARASSARLFRLLDTPSTIQSPAHPVRVQPVRGEIAFRDVRFAYSSEYPVLRGLSFGIRPGETLGIAGQTGCGKSTLIKLLVRFYDVTGGEVLIDGVDIRGWDLQDLRRAVSVVSQDVYLFHGTIYENIAYSLSGVGLDDVMRAAQSAQLHDFVMSLPDQYQTMVGERGIKLSGGQRQRLSIARAILKNAPIMVFDEATSAVDTETEKAIQQNLAHLTAGKTALIIAHRLSTLRGADRILVLEAGRVSEEGTHGALVSFGGVYSELWRTQTGDF